MKHENLTTLLAALFIAAVSPVLPVTAAADRCADAKIAIKNLQSADSTLTNIFTNSAGYAVFPRVGKVGCPGAEHAKGLVYERGELVGEATLTEENGGTQVRGEAFYEIVFFETAAALENFKQGHLEVSATVNPVAAAEGAALNANYRQGVLVFTMPRSGLMAQIAIGGQRFSFTPLTPSS